MAPLIPRFLMTRHASGCSILYGYHAAPARPYRTPGRSRMIPDNAEDYLVRAQEALNMHDMNARKEVSGSSSTTRPTSRVLAPMTSRGRPDKRRHDGRGQGSLHAALSAALFGEQDYRPGRLPGLKSTVRFSCICKGKAPVD